MRNRWQRIEKGRKLREEGADLKNRCHACGQPKRGHVTFVRLTLATLHEPLERGPVVVEQGRELGREARHDRPLRRRYLHAQPVRRVRLVLVA